MSQRVAAAAGDSAEMAMTAHLGVSLHARPCKLGSLQGLKPSEGCAVPRSVNPVSSGAAVVSRRGLALRASHANTIRAAKKGAPPMMPAVLTPSGPVDLSTLMFRNRIIFVGSSVNSEVAQSVISKLLTLAAINDEEEIKMYINCPGGSTYSIMAIFDAMQWIKPDVSTVCFGIAASQGALLLAGGKKGKRFAMPNARIMIHQLQGGCGGTADDVRRQVNEVMSSRDKIDKMYSTFCNQPLERVRKFTERDYFFSAAEALDFGLIDGLLETEF